MTETIIGPTSHYFISQRLKLHYVDWGNHDKPLALMIHGGRDHCRNWDWTALALRRYFHLIALDLRGHGDSDWAIGGAYTEFDHLLDIDSLMVALGRQPVTLIGHSLGARLSLTYAGVFPDAVKAVVAIEGMGPPREMMNRVLPKGPVERRKFWVSQMQSLAQRKVREYPTIEAAFSRMQEENPHLTAEQARHLTIHGVRRNENGTYSWKFDNYTRANYANPGRFSDAPEVWSGITAPCLLIRGADSWHQQIEQSQMLKAFRNAEVVTIADAGHWVHHDQLEEFLEVTSRFLGLEG